MDFDYLNKTEARLQKLEKAIAQPLMGDVALSSVSIEQQTLSDLLVRLLASASPRQQSELAIAAADAVKAAFERLNLKQKE